MALVADSATPETAVDPPAAAARQSAKSADTQPPGVRTLRRWPNRRKASPLSKIGMAVFAVGLVALLADVALFASGTRHLPLWLNWTAALAVIGLAIGLIATVLDARHSD